MALVLTSLSAPRDYRGIGGFTNTTDRPTCAARPLHGGAAVDEAEDQGVHAANRIVDALLGQPRVDHVHDAVDGHRRLPPSRNDRRVIITLVNGSVAAAAATSS
jgi:hypothetical protein